jgi:hypothetical protein
MLQLTIPFILNHIGYLIEPFAIKVFKEVQLFLSLTLVWKILFEVFHNCGSSLFE